MKGLFVRETERHFYFFQNRAFWFLDAAGVWEFLLFLSF